ncbi:MAG: hypothetical protein OEX00_02980 [Gammaproteobacteria bacterium]|nr:hypothetical protein [Gammaproteobacteria bacterium]MDH5691630.1 hypothetical protein [Gammaproteobacteria bacterium]
MKKLIATLSLFVSTAALAIISSPSTEIDKVLNTAQQGMAVISSGLTPVLELELLGLKKGTHYQLVISSDSCGDSLKAEKVYTHNVMKANQFGSIHELIDINTGFNGIDINSVYVYQDNNNTEALCVSVS